jgi:hypothetical protein
MARGLSSSLSSARDGGAASERRRFAGERVHHAQLDPNTKLIGAKPLRESSEGVEGGVTSVCSGGDEKSGRRKTRVVSSSRGMGGICDVATRACRPTTRGPNRRVRHRATLCARGRKRLVELVAGASCAAVGARGGGCRPDRGGSDAGEHRWKGGLGTVRRRSESAAMRGRSGFACQPDGGRGRGALLYSQGSVDWGESAAASRDDYGGENGARFARLVQRTSICW